MQTSIMLFVLMITFAGFALLFSLPKLMLGKYLFLYPFVLLVHGLAFVVLFFAMYPLWAKMLNILMLFLTYVLMRHHFHKMKKFEESLNG